MNHAHHPSSVHERHRQAPALHALVIDLQCMPKVPSSHMPARPCCQTSLMLHGLLGCAPAQGQCISLCMKALPLLWLIPCKGLHVCRPASGCQLAAGCRDHCKRASYAAYSASNALKSITSCLSSELAYGLPATSRCASVSCKEVFPLLHVEDLGIRDWSMCRHGMTWFITEPARPTTSRADLTFHQLAGCFNDAVKIVCDSLCKEASPQGLGWIPCGT